MLNSHVEGQNRDPFYSFCRFFYEKRIFRRLSEGHTKEFKGPHAARGPQVAHGWYKRTVFFLPGPVHSLYGPGSEFGFGFEYFGLCVRVEIGIRLASMASIRYNQVWPICSPKKISATRTRISDFSTFWVYFFRFLLSSSPKSLYFQQNLKVAAQRPIWVGPPLVIT
jgi:hypothetical protein